MGGYCVLFVGATCLLRQERGTLRRRSHPRIWEAQMKSKAYLWQGLTVIMAMAVWPALAAPTCPIDYGARANAKSNKLYLYFPSADDPTFPEFGKMPNPKPMLNPAPTSPLHRFDVSELPDYKGTVGELR